MGWLKRAIGVVIALAVVAAAGLLWLGVASTHPSLAEPPSEGILFGLWTVLYSTEVPPLRVLLIALAMAIIFAVGVALLERRASNRSRRSTDPTAQPLAPRVMMEQTRGVYAGPVTITVLIPAHNEEASLPATLRSLFAQSHRPERIIVVADNCTDGTVEVARRFEVEVFETVDNSQKKAGALNQVLADLLPEQGDNDAVMVMDADTAMDDGFLEAAVRRMTVDRALMAVGGLFYGEEGFGILGQMQRNEYLRYSRDLKRRRGRVFVLTGTASIFRATALRAVAAHRGGSLPGRPGDVYDTFALTEDNELTLALKSLGGLIISPSECTVVTELMPTVPALWRQRLRWQRGALENIATYGVTPPMLRYWAQQLGIGYSVIALSSFFVLMILTALAVEQWVLFPFWLGIGSVFLLERVITVWHGGWRARLLAATVIPELLYDVLLDVVYVKGIVDITFGRTAKWGHVQRTQGSSA